MSIYITLDETMIIDQIGGAYDLRHKDDYLAFIPTMASTIASAHGYDDALAIVDRVITQVNRRASASRAPYKIYELESYAKFLCQLRQRIEDDRSDFITRQHDARPTATSSRLGNWLSRLVRVSKHDGGQSHASV